MSYVVISIAFDKEDEAKNIAKLLVEHRLAACAQISQIHSTYRWNDKVETAGELLLQIKTQNKHIEAIEKLVLANHSYDVPEIIAQPISWAHETYGQWIVDNT